MTKFCKDCKYAVGNDMEFLKCSYTFDEGKYLSNGKKEPKWYCSVHRNQPRLTSFIFNLCGHRGIFYDPKNSNESMV